MAKVKIGLLVFGRRSSVFVQRSRVGGRTNRQKSKIKGQRPKPRFSTCHSSLFLRVRYTQPSLASADEQIQAANQSGIPDRLLAARPVRGVAVAGRPFHRINAGADWLPPL